MSEKETYKELLGFQNCDEITQKKMEKLLELAWKIRNFEIELFWERTTYFSVLVGALFLALDKMNSNSPTTISHLGIIFLGCISSFIWFLSNKASKFWQENWEHHIDLLEKETRCGDIYQLVLRKEKAVAFSVSRLSIYLSHVIFDSWVIVYLFLIPPYLQNIMMKCFKSPSLTGCLPVASFILAIQLLAVPLCIIYFCSKTKSEKNINAKNIEGTNVGYIKRNT